MTGGPLRRHQLMYISSSSTFRLSQELMRQPNISMPRPMRGSVFLLPESLMTIATANRKAIKHLKTALTRLEDSDGVFDEDFENAWPATEHEK